MVWMTVMAGVARQWQPQETAAWPATGAKAVTTAEQNILTRWQAGRQVSLKAVQAYGIDRCFEACDINDAVFRRMQGKSYKAGCPVPRQSLRYLKMLHYTADGKIQLGEMVCSRTISADLVAIFRQLFEARYPIERMVLIDGYGADDERSMTANNTSCFNYRKVAGSGKLSKHSQGRAVDINPLYNPCVRRGPGGTHTVSPVKGKAYADRSCKIPYKIDRSDLCYRLFKARGFTWGGEWRSLKDYQHFEK